MCYAELIYGDECYQHAAVPVQTFGYRYPLLSDVSRANRESS